MKKPITPDDAISGASSINRCKEIIRRNLHVGHDGQRPGLDTFKLESEIDWVIWEVGFWSNLGRYNHRVVATKIRRNFVF